MSIIELGLIAIGLSMDAFAVSICKGLSLKKFNIKKAVLVGLFFGGFQGIMPLIGWLVGTSFASYITTVDHWIAFILLGFIGFNMVKESLGKDDEEIDDEADSFSIKELFVLSIATSIDALAVGVSFAFLQVDIWAAVLLIGVITCTLSIIAVWIGNKFGSMFKSKAELAGGVILIAMGAKILIEHLNIL